jgi:hypothetical protein
MSILFQLKQALEIILLSSILLDINYEAYFKLNQVFLT